MRTRLLLCILLGLLGITLIQVGCGHSFLEALGIGGGAATGGISGGQHVPTPGSADAQFQSALRQICIPIAAVCILAGIGGLVASYFVPIIPRKAPAVAVASGFGLLLAYFLVLKFATAFVWIVGIGSLIVGIGCAVPFALHAFKWAQRKSGVDFPIDGPDSDTPNPT
jgi:hypothetical protein